MEFNEEMMRTILGNDYFEKMVKAFAETLPTDNFWTGSFLQGMMGITTIDFPNQFSNIPVIKKSGETSVVCCIVGEKALKDNKNNEALHAFTNALSLAPANSKMIAHCYYWRSIVLQKMKAFPESLQDIERALKLRITKEQKSNLLSRKKIIENLLLNESKMKQTRIPNGKNDEREKIALSYGENAEILGVSSAIDLVYNKKFGRHFVATRDIKVGDVLMIQKPFVFSPLKQKQRSSKGYQWICDNCLNRTQAPIFCEGCTLFFYCSFECQFDAYMKYHKTECGIVNEHPPKESIMLLYLRTLIVATNQGKRFQEVVDLKGKIQNCNETHLNRDPVVSRLLEDKKDAGFKDGKLDGTTANAVLSLLSHMDKREYSDITSYSEKVATALREHTDFLKRSDDVITLKKLLVFFSYICRMNSYLIRRSSFQDAIAHGLYPVFNFLNHSCACNTLSYDDKQRNKILRACKNIKKGEQIYVSYNTFQVISMTTQNRRKFLLDNKFFMCRCEACEHNYTYKPELRGALKIPAQLKKRLIKKPNNTESLWELLKLVVDEYKYPCMEAKTIELALINAHMGSANEGLCEALRNLCIL